MTLQELLDSPDYKSAAPDDRMRHIDEWTVQAKQDFPEDAGGLDEEIPRLRAREYVTAALPTLGVDADTAAQFRDLYRKGLRPSDSTEGKDWERYDQEYTEKDTALAAMAPEQRQKFAQFSEVMDRAGRHFQTAEEARHGMRQTEIDYGSNVKIPIVTKTLHDRKEVTYTYPDGSEETFEYALDEPPPDAERLRTFLVSYRPEKLGAWGDYLGRLQNFGAHATNAAVDLSVGGLQFVDVLTDTAAESMFGGKRTGDAAITAPLFVQSQTGPDGKQRWVKREKPEFLAEMPDNEYRDLQRIASDLATGKPVTDEDLDALYMNKTLSAVIDQARGEDTNAQQEGLPDMGIPGMAEGGIVDKLMKEQAEEGRVPLPETWAQDTEAERRELARKIAGRNLRQTKETREAAQIFEVDPSNLLATQEDQKSTDGNWWGAKTLDWLGDKAFNIPTSGQAIGSSAPILAATVTGGPLAALPFAGLMGAAEGNAAYEDVLQKNLDAGVDAETAQQRALQTGAAYAAVSAVLEQAGGVFEAGIFKGTVGKTRLGRAGMAFLPETTEEASQSTAQDLISNANLPDDQKKKALQIAEDALEAGAGALSFGVLPAAGGLRKTPATDAAAEVLADPEVPVEAKQAVAEAADMSIEAQAKELAAAGKKAAEKATTAPQEAPATYEAGEATLPAEDQAKGAEALAQRASAPLTYSDEAGDAVYQNGAWTLPDGTPAPNGAELEAKRQAYIQTGDMPEGMQAQEPEAPEVEEPTPATAQPAQPVTPATPPVAPPAPSKTETPPPAPQEAPTAPKPTEAPEIVEPTPRETPAEAAPGEVLEEPQKPGDAPAGQDPLPTSDIKPNVSGGFVVGFADQIPQDQRAAVSDIAAQHGAVKMGTDDAPQYYNQYRGTGAKPGFIFPDLQSAERFQSALTAAPATAPRSPVEQPSGPTTSEQKAPEITETVTTPPAKEKKARVARKLTPVEQTMRSREFKERMENEPDFISQIQHSQGGFFGGPETITEGKGKKAKVKVADKHKGEWDWYREVLEDPDTKSTLDQLFIEGAATLDDVSNALGMSEVEIGEKILAAARERVRIANEMRGVTQSFEERALANSEKQRLNFEHATREGGTKDPIAPEDLNPGDVLMIDATPVRVTEVDYETGSATLEDGSKFGRQTLPEGETIWVEEHQRAGAEELPKFSARQIKDHPELQFEKPAASIDEVVSKLDESARVPGMTADKLAQEVTTQAGSRIKELAAALGYKADARDIAQQLIADSQGSRASKRADEATAEAEKRPQMEGEGTSERALTPEEKLEKRKGGEDEAPEGTRPEDFEDEIPQPNPFMRFSGASERPIKTGVSAEDVDTARKALARLLPNATTAWSGTRKELEKHLAGDARFRWQWKRAYRATHPGATDAQTNKAFTDMLEHGLDGKEGFTFSQQTYLISDQIAVRQSDGTPANAVRRVLIHEDAHEGLRHLRRMDDKVEAQWGKFRDAIPAEELDTLAQKYTWLANWRNSPQQHDLLADEWFAAKVSEAEKRGKPEPSSLVGRFMKWLKDVLQTFTGDGQTITDKALVEFMDAARQARFRDRLEAQANGIRFSGRTTPDGDMPQHSVIETQVNDGEWKPEPIQPPKKPTRYNLMSEDKRAEYEAYQNNPEIPDELKRLSEFLGNPTSNVRLRQSLGILIDYARATLGSFTGEPVAVSAESTEKAWQVVKAMLTKKTFSGKYRKEFTENWSPQDSAGRAIHQGDAAAAVLQMELMDYAVRLAAETGDTSMMSMLYPFANDVILADYATMSSAARALQVRSAAVRETGVWTSLRLTYAAMHKTAEEKAGGKQNLETLKAAVDTNANEKLKKDVEGDITDKLETSATGAAVTELVEDAQGKDDQYDTENYWERVLNAYSGEERANLHAFWQSLVKLDRLLQLEAKLDAAAGSQIQPSLADDFARVQQDPAKLKAAIAEEKKKLLELLGKVTADDSSAESKETRRKMTRDKRVKRAVKALSETQQARQMIERFENRNKRLKRDKPAWKQAFDDQVKTPKGKDDFIKAMTDAKVTEQTALRLFEVAAELNTERETRKAARPKKAPTTRTPKPKATKPAQTYEEEAQAIIDRATKEAKDRKAPSQLQEARKELAKGNITEQQFRDIAANLGVTGETLETLVDVIMSGMESRLAERQANKSARQATEEDRKAQAVLDTYNKRVTGDYKPKTKGAATTPNKTDTRAFIASVARLITEATLQQQEDPTWKRTTIIQAFLERGMSQAQAEQAADKLTGIIDRALREGQAKAAIDALKTLKKSKKLDPKKLGDAIRSRGLDPLNPNPVVAALAKEAGYEALTPDQFKRLAELDTEINNKGPHLAAKAYAEMDRILHAVRPRKSRTDIIAGSWVYSALSSLGVWALNWIHPIYASIRRLGVDLASIGADVLTGKTKATDFPTVFAQYLANWGNSLAGFASEAAFALKNDAYSNKVLEMFQSPHRMHQEMLDAAKEFRTGNPLEKVKAAMKFLMTSTDYMRRALASADQSWGGVIQQYVMSNEAMRMLMHKAGMRAEAAAAVLEASVKEGQKAMAAHITQGAEAKLVGIDAMQAALKQAINDHLGIEQAEAVEVMGQKEAAMEIGNRRGETGAWFDIVNGLLESLKAVSTAVLNRIGLPGRMIVGFPSVGANILNRSAYFTPLGIMRALHKMKWASDPSTVYEETMKTEGQARMRLIEGIIGTIGFPLLALMLKKDPEEEGLHVTGDGPSNKTVREAWIKQGHKPNHLEWVGSDGQVKASVSYARGGLDAMSIPFTFLGALDDMHLEGKKVQKKNVSFAWKYSETILHGLANQARFFGMKNLVSSFPTSTKESSIAGNVAYTAAPFIPWSGLIKSTTRIFTGDQDKTSWEAAIMAQLPIVSAVSGQPNLNAFGDPVGPQSLDLITKVSERMEYAGAPFFVGVDTKSKRADVYKFILSKGVAPAAPSRGRLESDNGFITDARWTRYVKLRGSYLVDAIREQKDKIQFMDKADASNAMEDISREATTRAKKEMDLD